MYEVITRWASPGSTGGLTIMYLQEASSLSAFRTALGVLWGAIDANLTTGTTWVVDTSGRTIDANTGILTGSWAEATPQTGSGAISASPVPNASQVLLRWRTDDVVGGRIIKGRSYVPGLASTLLVNGEVNPTSTASMSASAQTFAGLSNDLVIWHRPKRDPESGVIVAPGSAHAVVAGSAWNELAVQRGRRA